MALRFVDPDATTTAEVDGVKFTIGYWPPREAERVEALRAALMATWAIFDILVLKPGPTTESFDDVVNDARHNAGV